MQRRFGFTMMEMLVVVGIIALLMAIIFPVYSAARHKAYTATCTMNLQKISQALSQYRQDEGSYPDSTSPMATLKAAKFLDEIPTCPVDPKGTDSYGKFYNYWGYRPSDVPRPLATKEEASAVYPALTNPATGKMDYWLISALDADANGPDAAFPGLAIPSPEKKTIVTVCANHLTTSKRYLILRLDGVVYDDIKAKAIKDADSSNPALATGDLYFWTLSKEKPTF